MCGIAGFLGHFDPQLLERMNSRIAHRGPDDHGTYHDPESGIGLAHRRLSIIDVSARGHQPMWDISRRVAIIYNGEIYNYRALRSRLQAHGFQFQSDSDTEILLNLYLEKGEAMLAELNGMFAFALWDTVKRQLFIARDGLGIKPLYYTQTPRGFLFASELKAFIDLPDLDKRINYSALSAYLRFIWSPAPETILAGVSKLEPGYALTINASGIKRYWQHYALPFDRPITSRSDEQAKSELIEVLKRSVERQMVADVPVGFFLSGGVDSSTVVAMAKKVVGSTDAFECFTIGVQGGHAEADGFEDDLPYAQAVAKHLGVKLNTVSVSHKMTTDAIEQMIYHHDEPIADPAGINVYLISQLARDHGIKVLLSGAGGDDIFTGYRRHFALAAERYWSWLPLAARQTLRAVSTQFVGSNPTSRRLRKAFQFADCDALRRLISYFYWAPPSIVQNLLLPAEQVGVVTSDPSERIINELLALPSAMPPMNKMLYVDQKYYLGDECLNYTDKMSMAASIEVRVPLLDREMVEFAAQLPIHQKQRGRHSKWLLKQVAADLLPADVINRSKVGFGVPLRRWMRNELRPMVDDLLSPASLKATGLFDPAAVAKLLEADRHNQGDWSYVLFSVVCAELWHRRFITGRTWSPR